METNTTSWLSSFPFIPHLNSNFIPSDAEVLLIKSWLVQPSRTLQKIENDMRHLKEKFDFLGKKPEELAHYLSACRSLVTLPRRLPDDILLEIFHHSLPPDFNACLKNHSAPLVFTQVCSRWRQLAISTPTLWTTIHIPLNDKKPQGAYQNESMLQEFHRKRVTAAINWMKQSGSLNVHISLFGGPQPIPSSVFDLYTKSLMPFSSRWRSLFLQAPSPVLQNIATIPARDLKALESLFLHFERKTSSHNLPFAESPWVKSELFIAPSLRKLSIRQDLLDPTLIRVNWSTLTHLEVGGAPDPRGLRHSPFLTLSKASSILGSCANLIYCCIELGPCWVEQDTEIQVMRLPVLRRLSIGERVDIQPFIEKLDMPVLEELDLRSTMRQDHSSQDHSNHLTILSKTTGSIQKLAIDFEFLSHQTFLESLQRCPYLVSLTVRQQGRQREYYERNEEHINHFRIDDPFLDRLTSDETNSLCPYLEEFICRLNGHFTLTGLLRFIWRKQMIGHTLGLAKLKNVSLECLPSPTNAYESTLPPISDLLRPYGAMKFQCRWEPPNLVIAEYGNSNLRYTDLWN